MTERMSQASTIGSTEYRRDIDGLRAIAVLAVVLYHAGLPGVPGGFVGVDVFFVISGYLITSIIVRELDLGRFSFAGFYERRARRILPAFLAMAVLVAALACAVLLPRDLVAFGGTLVSAALSVSNIHLWTQSGYFETSAELKPLLHTWSLGVEEQFYIVFPLLLVAIARWLPAHRVAVLAGLAVASFALSVVGVMREPSATFFLLPTRAWELALGSLLAVGAVRQAAHRPVREVVAWVGLAGVLGSVALLNSASAFPGPAALPACLGTAALIWAGSGEHMLRRLLSVGPMVFIGLISYSLYLWHWPLFSLHRYLFVDGPGPATALALVGVSIGLAWLSWRFVEGPIRRREVLASRPALFRASALGVGAVVALGAVLSWSGGWPQRLPAEVSRLAAGAMDRDAEARACMALAAAPAEHAQRCVIGSPGAPRRFAVVGDSHAAALMPAFRDLAASQGVSGTQAVTQSCPPVSGLLSQGARDAGACDRARERWLSDIAGDPTISTVFLVARWSVYVEGTRYGDDPGPVPRVRFPEAPEATPAEAVQRGLERTVQRLGAAGKRVVLVGPIPEVGFDVPSVAARSVRIGRASALTIAREDFAARTQRAEAILRSVAERSGSTVVWPAETLCDARACRIIEAGETLYHDDDHLSTRGARQLAPAIAGAAGDLAGRP